MSITIGRFLELLDRVESNCNTIIRILKNGETEQSNRHIIGLNQRDVDVDLEEIASNTMWYFTDKSPTGLISSIKVIREVFYSLPLESVTKK